MKILVKKGQTSKLVRVFIQDTSVTTGAGLTGLLHNTASLTAYYAREGAAGATAISLVDMTVGTWVSGGFKAVDGTNLPGVYEIGLPDAVLASGADSVVVMLKGAANMAMIPLEIQLVSFDPNDAVSLGLSRLDAAISSIAASVWAYASRTLTQTAQQIVEALTGSTITVKRGDLWTIALTDIGSLTGRTKLWVTVKRFPEETDNEALLQITEAGGLIRLAGAAGTAADAAVEVDDDASGDITITVQAAASSTIGPVSGYKYDVQILNAQNKPVTVAEGEFNITADITKAIS